MTNSITPPPELVQQWRAAASNVPATLSTDPGGRRDYIDYIATCAATWAADQELEASCTWMRDNGYWRGANDLHASRRPKPTSLTDDEIDALIVCIQALPAPTADDYALDSIDKGRAMVRRALEKLQGLEADNG